LPNEDGSAVQLHFGEEVANILSDLPGEGYLFPNLARKHEKDRAKQFMRRYRLVQVNGVCLHSYRYAWAERAPGRLVIPNASPKRHPNRKREWPALDQFLARGAPPLLRRFGCARLVALAFAPPPPKGGGWKEKSLQKHDSLRVFYTSHQSATLANDFVILTVQTNLEKAAYATAPEQKHTGLRYSCKPNFTSPRRPPVPVGLGPQYSSESRLNPSGADTPFPTRLSGTKF
jgi:hypothetical protein